MYDFELNKVTKERLVKYPTLSKCISKLNKEDPFKSDMLSDITVYVRRLNIDEAEFFGWDEETAEDFYTWGHNSRYANVFEPMLFDNFQEYIDIILEYLEDSGIKEPNMDDLED